MAIISSLVLTGKEPKDTYQNLVEITSSGAITNGLGVVQTNIWVTSSYATTSSYVSSSALPIVNADPSTKGSATDTVTLTVDAQGRITSWTSQAITLTTGGTYNITSSWANKAVSSSYTSNSLSSSYALSSSYSPVEPDYSSSISSIKQNTLLNTLYTLTSSLSLSSSYYPTITDVLSSSFASSSISSSYSPVEPNYSSSVSLIKQNTLIEGNTYTITSSCALNLSSSLAINFENITSSITPYSASLTLSGYYLPIYISGSTQYIPLYT